MAAATRRRRVAQEAGVSIQEVGRLYLTVYCTYSFFTLGAVHTKYSYVFRTFDFLCAANGSPEVGNYSACERLRQSSLLVIGYSVRTCTRAGYHRW